MRRARTWAYVDWLPMHVAGDLVVRFFFIRKAIGWVLREVSRKRPELTRAFLAEHAPTMAGVTRREAGRLLPVERPRRHG